MPSSKLKELIREKVREKLRARSKKERKQVEGRVNIEGVTTPKFKKPKEKKQEHSKQPTPASVSIGAHGGRYVQEPSGHKRYLKEGTLSGKKKLAKSLEDTLHEIVAEDQRREFVTRFKRRKSHE